MAGYVNSRKLNEGIKLCDIILDGGILSNVKATLVKELIKYILYERQQIPTPFDHLKKDTLQSTSKPHPEVGNNVSDRRRRCMTQTLEEKKKSSLLSSLTELLSQVEEVFRIYPELTQVLLLLGGTVVSPKESFLIRLPPPAPEVELMKEKTCIKSLFRQLISHDLLGNTKSILPTNLSLLVYAPRNSGISWFKPKPTFKTPARGRQFIYNIMCRHQHAGSHDMSCEVSEVEISGIEPLDGSVVSDMVVDDRESIMFDQTVGSSTDSCDVSECLSAGSSSNVSNCTVLTLDGQMEIDQAVPHGQMEADTIWYQAPLVVKGYKEKVPVQKLL